MKYRKKPVVIEAYKPYYGDAPDWFEEGLLTHKIYKCADGSGFDIVTLEGLMHASPGDYIMKGIQGELYPCKSDIFNQTYELVE